jgi:GxxExxY protein
LELGFSADLIIENSVVVELKSIETIAPVHSKVVLTYLRLSGIEVELLINFNVSLLIDGITRLVLDKR